MQPCTFTREPKFFKNSTALLFKAALSLLTLLCLTLFTNAQDVLMGLTSNGGPEGKGTAFSFKPSTKEFSVIKPFADWGAFPVSDLLRGSDGAYYGMTPEGGTYNNGTIFRLTSSGAITIIKNFNMPVDGGYPKGSLIQAKDGNFYGTTSNGGPNNGGVIFKLTPAGVYSIVRSFSINTDGGRPQGRLLQGKDSAFYGINSTGGSSGYGTIFKLTTKGVYTVLKTFNATDGASSSGSLIQATDGNLYGMTYLGGAKNFGTIFKITTSGTYTVLRSFSGVADGGYPRGSLIQAKDGYLYGITNSGGTNYNGTIFKMHLSGAPFTTLRHLSGSVEGGNATGDLVQASDGSFYALMYSISGGYHGSAIKMTTSGTVTVIKKFTSATEGGYPKGSLIIGSDGQLYGMTNSGGKNGSGTIFKLTTSGSITVLAHLNGADMGNTPQDALVVGKDSAIFGVTRHGGATNYGTVFKICGGITTVLRSFTRNTDGGNPAGGLVRGKDGNLYGATETGGTNGGGTIFKITPTGSFTVLRHMKGATDGEGIKGTLTVGPDSALYGIAYSGGTGAGGTIFRITTGGSFSVLRHLTAATDGSYSEGGLVLGKDGFLYGMTGTNTRFFKISKDGAFTAIKTLSYATDGGNPTGSLIQTSDGTFWGTMSGGGPNSGGVIFKITASGTYTKLRILTAATDGGAPKGGLVLGTDGAFYGTTSTGGTGKWGTIFKLSTGGTYTVLRHLDIVKDGGAPLGSLVIAPVVSLKANAQTGITTAEDVSKSITLSGSGATGFTYTIVTQPKNGTISSGTGASRTYAPRANYYGKDSFAFKTVLGCLSSSPAWVVINVTSVNDAPVLAAIGAKSVVKGTKLSFTATATDVDAGQTKTFSLVSPPSGATINATSGVFSWTPTTAGTYSVKVKVADNGSPALSDEETITVTVAAAKAANSRVAMANTEPSVPAVAAKSSLYPNPVVSQATIVLKAPAKEAVVHIVDARGAVVSTQRFLPDGQQQLHIDASALKAGYYLVQVQTEGGTETLKMIKQ